MQKTAQTENSETHLPSFSSAWKTLASLAGMLAAVSAFAIVVPGPVGPQATFELLTNYNAVNPAMKVDLPASVKLADFNRDGYLDFVVGYSFAGGTNVVVRYGLGDGTFGDPVYVQTGLNPVKVAAGDLNGDGIQDVVAACPSALSAYVSPIPPTLAPSGPSLAPLSDVFSLVYGTGINPPAFAAFQGYPAGAGSRPSDVLITDLNSDGLNDIVITLAGSNSIAIFLARGDETFAFKTNIAVGANPSAVAAGDFNGDGRTDLAVVNKDDNTITVLLGYQDGTFASPFANNPTGGGPAIANIAVVDFNRDGYPDLLVTKPGPSLPFPPYPGIIVGLKNNGFGAFLPTFTNSTISPTPTGIKVADFNGDGTNDFATTSYDWGCVEIFMGNGTDFTFCDRFTTGEFPIGGPVDLDAGDLNGDGVPDLVVVNKATGDIAVFLNLTPVGVPLTAVTDEDTTLDLTLAGTTNVALTYTVTTQPTNGGGFVMQPTFGGAEVVFYPDPDFYGTTFFEYTVADANIVSVPVRVYITVRPVNDAPYFDLDGEIVVPENWRLGMINSFAQNISIGPANERYQGYKFILNNDNPTLFSTQPYMLVGGRLMFMPNRNSNGVANVTVVMEDTGGTNNNGVNRYTNSFTLTVTPVNNAPTITLMTNNVIVLENSGPVSIPNFVAAVVGPADEVAEGQTIDNYTFTLTSNLGLFENVPVIDASGTLTFTPAAYSNGYANFTIRAQDTGGIINPGDNDTSLAKSFRITVKPVNQPPTFTLSTTEVTCYEDATNQVVTGFVDKSNLLTFNTGPANEAGQGYSFIVQVIDNPSLFITLPQIRKTDGALIYRPRPNYNGVANVRAIMRDTGGTLDGGNNSFTNTFTITVLPVNDPPTARLSASVLYVYEDCAPVVISNFFRNILTGPTNDLNETTQSVTFLTFVNPGAETLFAVPPTITVTNGTNGVLSFTPAPDAFGEAQIAVELHDNGPSSLPNESSYTEYKFALRILPVNDAPVLTINRPVVSVPYNAGYTETNVITAVPGPANETGQALTLQIVNNTNRNLFVRGPAIYPNGALVFTPSNNIANVGKSVTLGVRAVDGGGTLYGGKNVSPYQTNLTIVITAP